MNEITVKKKRRSARTLLNLLCGLAEHGISAGLALVITPFLIRRLGIETYGLYPAVLEISALFGIIFGVLAPPRRRGLAASHPRIVVCANIPVALRKSSAEHLDFLLLVC